VPTCRGILKTFGGPISPELEAPVCRVTSGSLSPTFAPISLSSSWTPSVQETFLYHGIPWLTMYNLGMTPPKHMSSERNCAALCASKLRYLVQHQRINNQTQSPTFKLYIIKIRAVSIIIWDLFKEVPRYNGLLVKLQSSRRCLKLVNLTPDIELTLNNGQGKGHGH